MTRHTLVNTILLGLVVTAGSALSAQDASQTSVRDGAYTSDQSARGETAYRDTCASCHGDSMEGGGQAPPLAGSEFTSNWNELTAWDLVNRIRTSMPADHPGTLSAEQTALIVAYIFKVNSFPAGSKELPAGEDALKAIRIDAPPKSK